MGKRKAFEELAFMGRELEGMVRFYALTSVIFKNYIPAIQRAGL